jgi:hypothetical protein
VVAGSTANVDESSAPATLDGVTLVAGERVLLKDQTDAKENGIYVFNGAASAMTRATDFDDDEEFLYGAKVYVREGTVNADTTFKLTSDNVVVGTDNITFVELEDHLITTTEATPTTAYSIPTTLKDADIVVVDDSWAGARSSSASSGSVASQASLSAAASGGTVASVAGVASSASLSSRASVASAGTVASVTGTHSLASLASSASQGTLASTGSVTSVASRPLLASMASVGSTTSRTSRASRASFASVASLAGVTAPITLTLTTGTPPITIKRTGSGASYVSVKPASGNIDGKDQRLLDRNESIDVFEHNTQFYIK